jgi:hypothetical protein
MTTTINHPDVAWRLAPVAGGFSFMLWPLSAAALASVTAQRAGLASSVANTTRQVGTVVGIALLGALVQTKAAARASGQLIGLPRLISAPISEAIGRGGAQFRFTSSLPVGWTANDITRVAGNAYVEGIRAAFILGGGVLLVAAVAACLLRGSVAPRTSRPTTSPRPLRFPCSAMVISERWRQGEVARKQLNS